MIIFVVIALVVGAVAGYVFRGKNERVVFRDSTVIDRETVEPFARVLRILNRLDHVGVPKIEVRIDDGGAYQIEVYHKTYRGATLGIALCEAEAFFRKVLDERRAHINKDV